MPDQAAMNPFRIEQSALISFSGGRTSGFMLWHILQAFGGSLPKDVRVAFANTGKELEETLIFVRECGRRWGVDIVWLEYERVHNPQRDFAMVMLEGMNSLGLLSGVELVIDLPRFNHTYRVVDFETASRKGEPFEAMIQGKSFLPNKVMRFCTQELKVRIMKKWMVDQGYQHWNVAVGIRADEPHRLSRDQDRERYTKIYPLADAGVSVGDVMGFWAGQPFDLGLRQDQGNCDLCFLKGKKKLAVLVTENPRLAGWWVQQESIIRERAAGVSLAQFNSRFSYADLLERTQGGPMFKDGGDYVFEDEPIEDCHCTD